MIRDNLKDENYFKDYIAYQQIRIDKFEFVLKALNCNDTEKIIKTKTYLAGLYKDLMAAKYSIGANKEEIKQCFIKYSEMLNAGKITAYSEMVDILALSIIFDLSADKINKVMQNNIYDDSFVILLKNRILNNNKQVNPQNNSIKYKYYTTFYEFLNNKIKESEFADYIENKWYPESSDFPWYDAHNNKNNIYVGYWCWIGTALLKLKKCNKTNIKYIPNDLI